MIKDSGYKLGDRFKRRLPKFVGRIGDMSDLFQAEDKEFDVIDQLIFDFSQAMHIANLKKTSEPDYYISKLERDYALPSTGSIDERIARIILKMRGLGTTNAKAIVDLCKMFGYVVLFKPRYSEYCFELIFVDPEKLKADVFEAIDEIKPAHLGYYLRTLFYRELIAETREDHLTYPIFLCGERKCGTIPEDKFIGTRHTTALGIKVGLGQHRDYYGYTNGGHRAGELRAEKEEEIIYMQDLKSEAAFTFTEDDHD